MSASIGFKATELGFTNTLILGTPVNKFWQQKNTKITNKSWFDNTRDHPKMRTYVLDPYSLLIEIWFSRLPADFSTTHIYTLHPFGHRRLLGIPRRLRQRGRSQLRRRGGARQAHGTRLPWRLGLRVPYGLVDELVTIQHMGIWLVLMVVKWWFFKVVHGISPTTWWLIFFWMGFNILSNVQKQLKRPFQVPFFGGTYNIQSPCKSYGRRWDMRYGLKIGLYYWSWSCLS